MCIRDRLGAAALAYALMLRAPAFAPISSFHLAQSLAGAGGSNAVNTIIVDFRGFDTYGEIIVLGIAALLIFALVEGLLSPGAANDRLLALMPGEGDAGDRHPMMFVMATRIMLPFAMMVGVYLYPVSYTHLDVYKRQSLRCVNINKSE